MALAKCKECGAQVSTKAKACPSCGAAAPKKTSLITWMVLGFIVLSVLVNIFAPDRSAPASKTPEERAATAAKKAEADQRAKEYAWIEKGKETVLTKLKDPASAEFKDVFFNRGKDGVPVACGQVNSKNSFGGYGGFQLFVSAGSPELTFLQEQAEDFHVAWDRFCVNEQPK